MEDQSILSLYEVKFTNDSNSPKRIQRKRTKGWRMPPNAKYVGRPSRWGNPFALSHYEREVAILEYEAWLKDQLYSDPHFLDSLRGKDLACWCPLDKPCHADIILKFLREGSV